ncbi:MAG: hypothetical protein IJJ33_06120, partial [Victivallales bacterium]|nr:hypothetical protein [Victivallales bacterium]
EASFYRPGLTTIGGVMDTMAMELAKALDHAVKGASEPYQTYITPKLILRSTTTKPRSLT